MLWLRVLALVGVGGCGRFGFDDASQLGGDAATDGTGDGQRDGMAFVCAPVGHDEDGDGTDDACDVCPHLVDTLQGDVDGDRVGDACDLQPNTPRQQIVFFDAFTALDTAVWTTDTGATVAGDELVLEAIGSTRSIYRPYTQGEDWFIIGATTASAGVGDHQIALVTSPDSGGTGFYCEMANSGGTTATEFTYTLDGSTFLHDGIDTWAQSLENGGGELAYLLVGPEVRCRSAWLDDVRSTVGTWPTAITPERLTLYAENIAVRVQWIILMRTLP